MTTGTTGTTVLEGRVWKLGDNVLLSRVLSPRYDELGTIGRLDELVGHLLEDVVPGFAGEVRSGDVIVTGNRFGVGKHHFWVIRALQQVGVSAVLAESIDPLFQRESIDRGLFALACPGVSTAVVAGERVRIDLLTGVGQRLDRKQAFSVAAPARLLVEIAASGGLEEYTLARLAAQRGEPQRT
jgi:3-isopropylmalate/(R)-2-methylmalate dehydratase small subunit